MVPPLFLLLVASWFAEGLSPRSLGTGSTAACSAALQAACPRTLGAKRTAAGVMVCDVCASKNQQSLRASKCSAADMQSWCAAAPSPPGGRAVSREALNVLDFGAVPDGDGNGGGTDNAAALQAAIDAAQEQGKSLFVPAGRFMVNHSLVVGCSETAATCSSCPPGKGCGAAAAAKRLHPLHLFGEDQYLSVIATVQPLHAVIEFAAAPAGDTQNHQVMDLTVDGGGLNACVNDPPCGQANYSIYARAITRSTFARLNLLNSKVACLSLAYGWINRVTNCLFSQCFVGLHLWDEANNADIVQNNFYGNSLPMVIEQAAQINIEGNVIEGNDGPAITATAVEGLSIVANYFEANNRNPALNTWQLSGGRNVTVNADIVPTTLLGTPSISVSLVSHTRTESLRDLDSERSLANLFTYRNPLVFTYV